MALDLAHIEFSSSPRSFARPEPSISAVDLASSDSSSSVQAPVTRLPKLVTCCGGHGGQWRGHVLRQDADAQRGRHRTPRLPTLLTEPRTAGQLIIRLGRHPAGRLLVAARRGDRNERACRRGHLRFEPCLSPLGAARMGLPAPTTDLAPLG